MSFKAKEGQGCFFFLFSFLHSFREQNFFNTASIPKTTDIFPGRNSLKTIYHSKPHRLTIRYCSPNSRSQSLCRTFHKGGHCSQKMQDCLHLRISKFPLLSVNGPLHLRLVKLCWLPFEYFKLI